MPRRRLGWLGPAIVIAGAVIAGIGAWYIARARPEVGAVIDTVRIDDRSALVVRAEQGGDRNFLELREGERLVWRALVPPYAGRPGAPGLAEVFALAMRDAAKLGGFKLAPGKGPAVIAARGPVTLTDHVRSYEIVAGPGWHQLVAFDLSTGEGTWKHDLGAIPIDDGGVEVEGTEEAERAERAEGASAGVVWLVQGGRKRTFRATDGTEIINNPS
jgi:hypothetical protein